MQRVCAALFLLFLVSTFNARAAPAQSSPRAGRQEIYRVRFIKASLGVAAQLGDRLKLQPPEARHYLVLRHQVGDSWDYAVIENLGTEVTLNAADSRRRAESHKLEEWQEEAVLSGPPWPEFARAMGIDQLTARTADSIYNISVYHAALGHRRQLEEMLSAPPQEGNTSAGNVLLDRMEGGSWDYVDVVRYNSWHDFGANGSNGAAQLRKGGSGWSQVRDHANLHRDTLADRIAP